jgi:RecA-family ATPase
MTALDVSDSDELFNSQREFVKKVKRLAQKLDIAILLIAHPKKEGKGAELDNDSVSGTSDITNLVDVVMTYSKNEDAATKDTFQSLIGVTKNRLSGKLLKGKDRILAKYSARTKRIACKMDDIEKLSTCFQKTNCLDEFETILSEDDLDKTLDKYTFTL